MAVIAARRLLYIPDLRHMGECIEDKSGSARPSDQQPLIVLERDSWGQDYRLVVSA